jgi:hypothetical protein
MIIIIVAAFVSVLLQFTLMQSGQVITLNPRYLYYVNFTVPSGAYSISITGSYVLMSVIAQYIYMNVDE